MNIILMYYIHLFQLFLHYIFLLNILIFIKIYNVKDLLHFFYFIY